MLSFLVFFGVLFAVLYAFLRVFRSRVQRRMEGLEVPAEIIAAARSASAPHFLLVYDVGPDFLQRRAALRDEHLALAWKAADAGELVLAGALEEPTEQAFLLFRGSREAALRFAAADPYVKHGLVKAFRVRQWHTTVGTQASAPLRPQR